MKKAARGVLGVLLFLFHQPFLLGFDISTARITEARMFDTRTNKLIDVDKQIFSTTTPEFFIKALVKYAPEQTEVKASWYYLENGEDPLLIDEAGVATGSGGSTWILDFNLTRPYKGWPEGKYMVVLKVQTDNAEPVTLYFEVAD